MLSALNIRAAFAIRNPIDIIYNEIGIDTLAAKVVKPLDGSQTGFLLRLPSAASAGSMRV